MKWDLKLEEDGGSWVLYKCQGVIPTGERLCEWRHRKAFLQGWLDGSEDGDFTEILRDVHSILKESSHLTSDEQKQRVADWVIDSLLLERLSPDGEDVLCQTVQTLLFHVLIPRFSDKNMGSCPKELQSELHYTLRRWFALVKDPQRSWFERAGYPREKAIRDVLFDSQELYSFYALPGFAELAEDFARWFLGHYDLVTCAKIHAFLYRIRNERQPWWKKLWQPITHLFISLRHWWIVVLVLSLLLIFARLFLRLLESTTLSVPILRVGVSLALLLLFSLSVLKSYLILPRMLGAIGVGYILLLITTEVWEFAFRVWQGHQSLAWIIFFSSLLASFLYLVTEMGSRVPSCHQRSRRSLLVLGIGLVQSLLVGIASCLLVGSVFMREVMGRQTGIPDFVKFQIHRHFFSFDVALYPEVILFFAPVALFVGIFSQILWEEKEITSPL